MVDIMTHLHQYIPAVTSLQQRSISTGTTCTEEKARIHHILVGGDQLTAARARSAIKGKVNSQTPSKRLSGIVPVAEDWHAKANFLGVSHNCLYVICTSNTKDFYTHLPSTVDLEVLLQY